MRRLYGAVAALAILLTVSGGRHDRDAGAAAVATARTTPEHYPASFPMPPLSFPAHIRWLDEDTLVYPSRAGLELLALSDGRVSTLPGRFWRVGAAPGGGSVAFWGEAGLCLAARRPLQRSRLLWEQAAFVNWAREKLGKELPVYAWVEEILWSPDGARVAFLLRAANAADSMVDAVAVYDAAKGERLLYWSRQGPEGRLRTTRWAAPGSLLVQFNNYRPKSGPGPKSDTSTLALLDVTAGSLRPLATLPYPTTLSALDAATGTLLLNSLPAEYEEPVPLRPFLASLQGGSVTLQPVGEEGDMGLLIAPGGRLLLARDGVLVWLDPGTGARQAVGAVDGRVVTGQPGIALSPAGRSLAVPLPLATDDRLFAVQVVEAPAAGQASGPAFR